MATVRRRSVPEAKPDIAFYGFRGGPGGINFTLLNLMNEMASTGCRVHLVLHNTAIPERRHVHPAIKSIALPNGSLLTRSRHLSAYLNEFQPRAIISVREPGNRALIAAKMVNKVETKIAFRVGMPVTIALQRRPFLKRMLRKKAIRICYRRADFIIANHKSVAEDIAKTTGIPLNKIHVIQNGIVSHLLYEKANEPCPHPWVNRKEVPVILGIGRLARQKDFETLIKAFRYLNQRIRARLIILGEGKERRALTALIHRLGLTDSVDLYGYAENPYSFLSRADLFVLSSAWEGLPNVLIEATALGRPCVATDCRSGPREILENGRLGYLVPVGDLEAMAEAMFQALMKPPDPDFVKSGASRYDARLSAQRYLEVLGLG